MNRRVCLSLLLLSAASPGFSADRKVKVACVGDSITAGGGVENPENTYPKQLGRLLGDAYEVKNFGNAGCTMLDEGDKPYKKEQTFGEAVAYAADIVVIKLGTNDSKRENWAKKAGFALSAKSLVEAFQKANPKAQVFLCTAVPVMSSGNFGITNDFIPTEINPQIKRIAAALKLPVIDLYPVLDGHPELVPDRVHPNEEGATLIAKAVYEAVRKR